LDYRRQWNFPFKNIKELYFKNCDFPLKYIEHKKYFFNELLKGNVSWEKLNKLKITSIYTDLKYIIKDNIEEYINKEIINFFKIAELREDYEESNSEFFQDFFNFIFKNQNINIKTNKNCKNIEEFIIKLYDSSKCPTCQRDNLVYKKKGKNVNIKVGGGLYEYNAKQESPLQYIDLDSVIIDSSLAFFTIDNHSISELKYLKKYISEQFKINKAIAKKYTDIYEDIKCNYNNDKKKYINSIEGRR